MATPTPFGWLEVRGVEAILTPNRTSAVQPESQRRLILGAAAREPSVKCCGKRTLCARLPHPGKPSGEGRQMLGQPVVRLRRPGFHSAAEGEVANLFTRVDGGDGDERPALFRCEGHCIHRGFAAVEGLDVVHLGVDSTLPRCDLLVDA